MESGKLVESDPRARPVPYTFRPPKLNRFVIALFRLQIRRAIRRKLKVTEIDISSADLEKLRNLKGKRCLVTPSHSGGFEPHILMYLSKLLGDNYFYLAAMEAFEQSPIIGWIMQRLGAYSIIRGAADRPSFQMTRKILAEGKRWLVIFPEGQTVWQNSTVIPFQEGVIQIAFKAYEDAAKQEGAPSLHCIPIAIRYVYLQDMHDDIDASLERLEGRLFDTEKLEKLPRYARLRRVGEAVLSAMERMYGVSVEEDRSLNERIQDLKEHAVSDIEQRLSIKTASDRSLLDRIRTLFNSVDRIVHEEPQGQEYEQQLTEERQRDVRGLYDDLWRALQFVAVYDGYVSECMTVERFMDVLCLLEMEVFNERQIWGPRKALVKVGEPIDLKDHYSAYKSDRREVVENVTLNLESSVRKMLDALGADCADVRDSEAAET
jgi:1-acyl-sn-glycerol-3-phosphate acyltransferase